MSYYSTIYAIAFYSQLFPLPLGLGTQQVILARTFAQDGHMHAIFSCSNITNIIFISCFLYSICLVLCSEIDDTMSY